MQEVYRLIELAAPTPAAVLISGESGTGKELVARTLHELSPRGRGPFVAVNCAAIPETLLESEIFGHEKGAFTGALERRPGCFELADEGTHLPRRDRGDDARRPRPSSCASCRTARCGASAAKTEIKVDVRVVAATNKDPVKAMQEGTFREDLYYRLNVVSHRPAAAARAPRGHPAPRRRPSSRSSTRSYDKHIRARRRGGAERPASPQPWPGNVRELRNTLERAIIVCEGDTILPQAHAAEARAAGAPSRGRPGPTPCVPGGHEPRGRARRRLILKTLAANGNNKTRAADVLGISLKTLHNKLKTYGTLAAMRLGIRGREALVVSLLTLLVVATATAIHLSQVSRVVVQEAVKQAELIAKQIYAQSGRALQRAPGADPLGRAAGRPRAAELPRRERRLLAPPRLRAHLGRHRHRAAAHRAPQGRASRARAPEPRRASSSSTP